MNYQKRFNKLAAAGIIVVGSLLITSCGAEAPTASLPIIEATAASSVKVIHNDSNFDSIHAARIADEVRVEKQKQEAVAAAKAAEAKKTEDARLAELARIEAEALASQEAANAEAYRVQQEKEAQEQKLVIPIPQAPVEKQAPAVQANSDVGIYVGLAGEQDKVDLCAGPVLQAYEVPLIAEHDTCGGWARFGGLNPGMTVSLSGVIGGRYKITATSVIPSTIPGRPTYSGIIPERFGSWPDLVFQTCIPGTDTTLIVAAMKM